MDVYTVEAFGKKVNVTGTVYLNGKPIESAEYDEILWCAREEDAYAFNSPVFTDKKVLVLFEKDFHRACLMQELGY